MSGTLAIRQPSANTRPTQYPLQCTRAERPYRRCVPIEANTCPHRRVVLLLRHGLLALVVMFLPVGASAQTFNDIPTTHWAYQFIESLFASGITAGCGGGNYCPDDSVTRAQMAVFLERGINGGSYVPPPATGTVFNDVAASDFAAAFIEKLFADGITGGCGGGNYCPDDSVTRAQMAVFLLRARNGSSYVPPPAIGIFNDVTPASFAAAWIEQLAALAITSGCGGGNYCPESPVTRAQMAVFLVRTFNLPIIVPPMPLEWDVGNWDRDEWQ